MRADPRSSRAWLRRARAFACCALALSVGACEWFSDFKDQPRIEPWEAEYQGDSVPFRGQPQYSVPITGSRVPAFIVSYQPLPTTIDSMAGLENPQPPTQESLENGRKYYQINCTVCHGATGAGNGPVVKFGLPVPSLLASTTLSRTDGYIWGMIRNGRGLMPTYDRIEDMDRWDVVNYVRALQGRTGAPADTSSAGYPGENGRAVPGYTEMAPTRPAPYRGPGGVTGSTRVVPVGVPADTSAGIPGAAPVPSETPGGGVASPDSTTGRAAGVSGPAAEPRAASERGNTRGTGSNGARP